MDISPLSRWLSSKSLYICAYICISMLITNTVGHVYATHTSIPVVEVEEKYIAGRVYDISGIVLYNGQPASDVLVEIMINYPDGSSSEHLMVRSSSDNGRFNIKFKPSIQGYYTITATSHCMDMHRSICTYQSTVLEVAVYEERSINRICVRGECISIDPGITIMSIDSKIDDDSSSNGDNGSYEHDYDSGVMATVDNNDRLVIRFRDVGERAGAILALPSNVIDSPSKFLVIVDDIEAEHREYSTSTNIKVVDVAIKDYDGDGSAVVEIIGTYVIPEFPISVPLATGSILALLILHVSSWIRSDLKRRAS